MGNGSHSLFEVEAHRNGEVDLEGGLLFQNAVDRAVEMLGLGCWPVYMRPVRRVDETSEVE